MKETVIYEYDRKNRDEIVDAMISLNCEIISWGKITSDAKNNKITLPQARTLFIDITSFFINDDRVDTFISIVEVLLDFSTHGQANICIMIEKQYTNLLYDILYFKIKTIKRLESEFNIKIEEQENIVDIDLNGFDEIFEYFNAHLFGNNYFKLRLKEELIKFRKFNKIGYHPIFSLLICGASGIGKTEVARILHKKLSPDEPLIKINFGNYSAQDALNSLIGSPRGYIGSNKGELPDKLSHSKSKIILIDEFEKASKPIFNFFLQLLEEGKFTDSLGREYDLNKYIIIFTSNMTKDRVFEYIPPELRSRFSYKCSFSKLSSEEKQNYVEFKTNEIICNIKKEGIPTENIDLNNININVNNYDNIRNINNELMLQISKML